MAFEMGKDFGSHLGIGNRHDDLPGERSSHSFFKIQCTVRLLLAVTGLEVSSFS